MQIKREELTGETADADVRQLSERPRSLHPLNLGDLREIRASMALEGIRLTDRQFEVLIATVEDDFTGGSAEAAIENAKQWLAGHRQPPPTKSPAARQPRAALRNPQKLAVPK